MSEIDKYINQFPEKMRVKLIEMRKIIEEVLPKETTQKLGSFRRQAE